MHLVRVIVVVEQHGTSGAVIHENCEALSLVIERGSARAVVTQRGTMQADAILLTSGAWMALMSGTGLNLPPIKPVKGPKR